MDRGHVPNFVYWVVFIQSRRSCFRIWEWIGIGWHRDKENRCAQDPKHHVGPRKWQSPKLRKHWWGWSDMIPLLSSWSLNTSFSWNSDHQGEKLLWVCGWAGWVPGQLDEVRLSDLWAPRKAVTHKTCPFLFHHDSLYGSHTLLFSSVHSIFSFC